MDIQYRQPKSEDMPAILDILNSVSGDTRDVNVKQFLVAKCQNKIVGCARIKKAGDQFELASLAVLPDYRRQGIGTALVEKLISNEPQKRPLYLLCHKDNENFYQKLGFKIEKPKNLPKVLKEDYDKFLKRNFSDNPDLLVAMILQKVDVQ